MSGRLEGKIALITGGCSGIGLATTERFVAEGARVLVTDLQCEKGAMLERHFAGKVAYHRCDVTQEADIAAAVATAASAFGGLDILFNNAGTGGTPLGVAEMTIEAWDATFALLLRGPMLGIKHAAPLMIARGGGSVINTASIAGLEAGWGLAYGVAKAGVIQLSKLAAAELAVHNIRVNAICPGVIVTPIFGIAAGLERPAADQMAAALVEASAKMQPLRRAGDPADIASAALYLASDDSSFVTGTHLVVDGGITVGQRISWDPEAVLPLHAAMQAALTGNAA
ncbi:2,5-dichloro-2,5-cyclohexadiene-1,4-diol dehydrogenase [Polymorphobacter glacialis]|uniref:2,5-dichloro-2,5-cyclohexadiene-1,4-diol dehydrogenase n=1 Tax=Sandarakinorhabdus glacialis TaxID=1614636 RepID=A0A917E358_9SPHN|nr:glucose 1-dehydrogenase [Polymorphobacter glacialis]GGE00574.1 2,5-dichloro-2,5-cyclohexadiene-1,4-diol dehydrogenase [Polymorphobacter glacialis]